MLGGRDRYDGIGGYGRCGCYGGEELNLDLVVVESASFERVYATWRVYFVEKLMSLVYFGFVVGFGDDWNELVRGLGHCWIVIWGI